MKKRLLYALVAAFIAAATSMTASALVLTWVPKGKPREFAERLVVAPGQMIFARLHGQEGVSQLRHAVSEEFARLPHLYNMGAWASMGFLLCLLMTFILGVSSFKEALVLGFKVTLAVAFLHAALVLAGSLSLHTIKGL